MNLLIEEEKHLKKCKGGDSNGFKENNGDTFSTVVLCTSLTSSTYAETSYPPDDDGIAPAYEIAGNPQSNLSRQRRYI